MNNGFFNLKTGLPYKVHPSDRANENFKTNERITVFLLKVAVNNKWPQNMPRTDSRIWAEIQDQMIDEPEQLVLTKLQFDWLYDVVNNFEFPASLSSWRWTLIDHLQNLEENEKERSQDAKVAVV